MKSLWPPLIDWNGSFDYDALVVASDALFIMGYGYHWSGGDPGPIGPMREADLGEVQLVLVGIQDHMDGGSSRTNPSGGCLCMAASAQYVDSFLGQQRRMGEAVVYREAVPAGESIGRNYDVQTDTLYKLRLQSISFGTTTCSP